MQPISVITDLKLAPRDANGRVQFSADWRLLRPVEPQRGNHRLLFDILNRGRGPVLRNINSAPDVLPTEPLDPGNGFLMRQGYTVAWCGWQHDVPDAPGLMRIRAPEAVTPEGPISGKIVVTFVPDAPTIVQYLADRIHRALSHASPGRSGRGADRAGPRRRAGAHHSSRPVVLCATGRWSCRARRLACLYGARGFSPARSIR